MQAGILRRRMRVFMVVWGVYAVKAMARQWCLYRLYARADFMPCAQKKAHKLHANENKAKEKALIAP
jgi:hypothetical protein